MGFRFSFQDANVVANLTFGKVMSCYKYIFSSRAHYRRFQMFLSDFEKNLFSSEDYLYREPVMNARRQFYYGHARERFYNADDLDIKGHFRNYNAEDMAHIQYLCKHGKFYRPALDALNDISKVFERCRIKSLILPRAFDRRGKDFILSVEMLEYLAGRFPGDTCLILQPDEPLHDISIFDAFPNFDIALRQADLWPAILFWEKNDVAFVPIRNREEVEEVFDVIEYERYGTINKLNEIASKKKEASHYIFHLSDLHFGKSNDYIYANRLEALIDKQLSTIDVNDTVDFIITGDMVDSPNQRTGTRFKEFSDYIKDHYGRSPICVLGNHDVNDHGLAIVHKNQEIADFLGGYPKIEIMDELKVILLLFNSNITGKLACGEIGEKQMCEMGILLDEVEDVESYTLICLLHHHLQPIPKPDFYAENWYEKLIPRNLLEDSLVLTDADVFMDWLEQRNVKFVLHGHKHIPFIAEKNGINVIGCGSSTGQMKHIEKGKTYISYNVLKIGVNDISCAQFAEEVLGAGANDIRVKMWKRSGRGC